MRAASSATSRIGRDSPEVGVAHRCAGTTHMFAGEYRERARHLEQALGLCSSPAGTTIWRTASDRTRASREFYLALVLWPLGDAETRDFPRSRRDRRGPQPLPILARAHTECASQPCLN